MKQCGKILYSRAGHKCQESMWIACWINKATNLLLTRNNYCFSSTTMVARMRLNVMLHVHCLSCFILLPHRNINIEIKWHPELYNITIISWHDMNIFHSFVVLFKWAVWFQLLTIHQDGARPALFQFIFVLCYVFFLCCSMYFFCVVLCIVCLVFCFFLSFCALFVCKCVLYYCHRVSTQLQLTNISYHIKVIGENQPTFPYEHNTRNKL
jgi:hypothetical protein